MRRLIYMLLAAALLTLGACQSKNRVDELKQLVEEVTENGKDYTADQWEEASKKFNKVLEKINSYNDLSAEELQEVARLQGQYAATVFKNSGKSIMEQMDKASALMQGFLEGLDDETNR